jgi:hypothetical protein
MAWPRPVKKPPSATQLPDELAATSYTTGMEHSPTSATGTGWERTPWHATQRAAWEAFKRWKNPTVMLSSLSQETSV